MINFVSGFRSHAFAMNTSVYWQYFLKLFRVFSLESESLTLLAIRDYVAAVQSHKSVV